MNQCTVSVVCVTSYIIDSFCIRELQTESWIINELPHRINAKCRGFLCRDMLVQTFRQRQRQRDGERCTNSMIILFIRLCAGRWKMNTTIFFFVRLHSKCCPLQNSKICKVYFTPMSHFRSYRMRKIYVLITELFYFIFSSSMSPLYHSYR